MQHIRNTTAGDRPAQQVLAGPGVLVREEPAVHQEPGMIIDDQEQPGPRRAFPLRVRHPGPDEDVGDPPLVPPGRLIPAVRPRLPPPRPPAPPPPAPPAPGGPPRGHPPPPGGQRPGE